MLRCNFQILTSDQGLGRYMSIPLEGKKSYKVANVNAKVDTFSIVAFTSDDVSPKELIREGASQRRIEFELQWLSDIIISSASDAIYVNVAPVKEKQKYGNATMNAAGGIGVASQVKSMMQLGMTLYSWYNPSPQPDPEFSFSIGARAKSSTRLTVPGPISLGALLEKMNDLQVFTQQKNYCKEAIGLSGKINDTKEMLTGSYSGLSGIGGAFKSLFG